MSSSILNSRDVFTSLFFKYRKYWSSSFSTKPTLLTRYRKLPLLCLIIITEIIYKAACLFFIPYPLSPCLLPSIQSSSMTPGNFSSRLAVRPIRSLSIWQWIISLPLLESNEWKWNSSTSIFRSRNSISIRAVANADVPIRKTNTNVFFEICSIICSHGLVGNSCPRWAVQ